MLHMVHPCIEISLILKEFNLEIRFYNTTYTASKTERERESGSLYIFITQPIFCYCFQSYLSKDFLSRFIKALYLFKIRKKKFYCKCSFYYFLWILVFNIKKISKHGLPFNIVFVLKDFTLY